ncbi:ACT domain-containing protein [Streptomyces sp. L7]
MTVTQAAPTGTARKTGGSGHQASLIVQGADATGIVAAVTSVLGRHGANIVSLDQYSDNPQGGAFFQRTVFGLDGLRAELPGLRADFDKELGEAVRPQLHPA